MEVNPIPVITVQTSKRNYLQNFIQCVLSSIDLRDRQGCTMVVGSDGRYFSKTAIEIIVQMAAANGVRNRVMRWYLVGGSALSRHFSPHRASLTPGRDCCITFHCGDGRGRR
uniref:Alpha-D-phosphohexomutase alpha/beta/alpha domain-containing protein n=1 Tax=Leptobrachium leishanense TaxID=445787 RepID=A0A8C5PQZ7_9ANUR